MAGVFKDDLRADAGLVGIGLVDDDAEPLGLVYCQKNKRGKR